MAQLRNRITGLVRSSNEVEREIRAWVSCETVINFSDFGEDVVFPAPQPAHDPITQYVRELAPVLTVLGHYEQAYEVVTLDAETVAMNQAAEAERIAGIEASRIAALWQSAHDYEYAQVSGSAIGLLAIGVMQAKPKCLAVQGWIRSIWTEYYLRKSGTSTDYSFAVIGACPHSVPELMVELGL